MLLRNLFVKSLLDHRRGLAWWVLGVVLLSAAMTSFYPSISTNDAVKDYVDAFDPDLLALFGFSELLDITSGRRLPQRRDVRLHGARAGHHIRCQPGSIRHSRRGRQAHHGDSTLRTGQQKSRPTGKVCFSPSLPMPCWPS